MGRLSLRYADRLVEPYHEEAGMTRKSIYNIGMWGG
jgi:hypothetical protein